MSQTFARETSAKILSNRPSVVSTLSMSLASKPPRQFFKKVSCYYLYLRGPTALLVAAYLAQVKYCNSFQLTHLPRGNHALSIASNGDQKEDKTLLQHSQLSQHGEFWYISVSERQRSRPCGQNLRVPFLRTVLTPQVEESARAMAANSETKALISPPPV